MFFNQNISSQQKRKEQAEAQALNSFIVFHALHPTRPNTGFNNELPVENTTTSRNSPLKMDTDGQLSTDGRHSLNRGTYVAGFYAFVNDFEETFASSWESAQSYGKPDPIIGFKNTKRTISLSWKIPSASLADAQNAYVNLNKLAQMLYPSYLAIRPEALPKVAQAGYPMVPHPTGQGPELVAQPFTLPLNKPPLISVGWSNLIQNKDDFFEEDLLSAQKTPGSSARRSLVAHVENLSLSPGISEGFFVESGNMFPKLWNCGIALTIIHTHELGRQEAVW